MDKSKTTLRALAEYTGSFILALIIGVTAFTGYQKLFNKPSAELIAPDPYSDSAIATSFIGVCSGLDASDEAIRLIGLANCLGRVRGFVDSHQMTIKMQKATSAAIPAMWCVSSDVTDKKVLDSIIVWATKHPQDYQELIEQFDGLNAAMAVTIRAIHDTYPCKEAK